MEISLGIYKYNHPDFIADYGEEMGSLPKSDKYLSSYLKYMHSGFIVDYGKEIGTLTNNDKYLSPYLLLEEGDKWSHRSNLVKEFKAILKSIPAIKMNWKIATQLHEFTTTVVSPVHNTLDEETRDFIKQHNLDKGMDWLLTVVSDFFPGADFEIELLISEDEEDKMIALRVYGSLSALKFRELRHLMCKAMLEARHKGLYEVVSIFQRRMHNDERQAISWYSSLTAA